MRMPRIPASFENDQQAYLRDLSVAVNTGVSGKLDRSTPTDQVLLMSPSKRVFAVTVDDAGTLSATLVQE